jgi:hypothetical protein
MSGFFEWLKTYEPLAVWLGGIALVLMFLWDRIDRRRQFKETQAQLDASQEQVKAAMTVAEAAKQSATVTAALHRPYMGLSSVTPGGRDNRYWNITFGLMNFGTLPAFHVGLKVDSFVDDVPRSQHRDPTSVQVFPTDSVHITYLFDWGDVDGPLIRQQTKRLRLEVSIPYESEDGRRFEYKAAVAYGHDRFVVDSSNTVAPVPAAMAAKA